MNLVEFNLDLYLVNSYLNFMMSRLGFRFILHMHSSKQIHSITFHASIVI
jgi:hypothetical protein